MEARSVEALPEGEGWQFEPKWDGFRCLAFQVGRCVELRAKSASRSGAFSPRCWRLCARSRRSDFVLDGELVDRARRGALVRRAAECGCIPPRAGSASSLRDTGAAHPLRRLWRRPGPGCWIRPFEERRAALETVMKGPADRARFDLTPFTRDRAEAQQWLDEAQGSTDGVVAKRVDGPTSRASAPCSRSSISAPRIAWSAGSAMRRAAGWWVAAAGPVRRRGPAQSRRLYLRHFRPGTARDHDEAGGGAGYAWLYRWCSRRPQPLEHGAVFEPGNRCALNMLSKALRSHHWKSLPPWN